MKAIILAAGKGSRISDDIGPIPKSTLEINGQAIIRQTVAMLKRKNIDVAVCTGYRHEKIHEALEGISIQYFHNPFFNVMNNIGTLWFAKGFLDEECLILSADVVFEETVLDKIIVAQGDLLMVTDASRINDGDYFFSLDDEGNIIKYGPDLKIFERSCEYVGLSKISHRAVGAFKEKLTEMVNKGNYQCYFELVFFSFINSRNYQLKTIDISGYA